MRFRRERGFGYLVLIFALVAMGFLLAGLGQIWHLNTQREKETQLLDIGHQFSVALESYRRMTAAGQPDTPANLSDLLEDKRFPFPVRHLRKLYRDPMTGQADWQVQTVQEQIVSISSRSERVALRQVKSLPDFVRIGSNHLDEARYCDWVFIRKDRGRPALNPPLQRNPLEK